MKNWIEHIEIYNFKSIQHQVIDGCKRINVFIGYPNVGKSNILEAMSMFSYLEENYSLPISKLCRLQGFSELFYDGNISSEAVVKYTENIKLVFRYSSENVLDFTIQEREEDWRSDSPGWMIRKHLRFSDDRAEFRENQNYKFQGAPEVKKYDFQPVFNKHRTSGSSLYSPYGENLFDVIQLNDEIRKDVLDLFKQYDLTLTFDRATNSLKVLKRLEDGTVFIIPFYQIADTLQRLIFYKTAMMSNKDTVLLFEEPESHMFPPYISRFAGDIIHDKKNNQYFIATHSPFVINEFIEHSIEELSVYLVGYNNKGTTIKRLTNEELHEVRQYGVDLFFNIESYLDQ